MKFSKNGFLYSRSLNSVITQQRIHDRLLKARQEQEEKDMKIRNKKILEAVNEHFPDIDIMTRHEKHREAIEKLAKPRNNNTNENI